MAPDLRPPQLWLGVPGLHGDGLSPGLTLVGPFKDGEPPLRKLRA